MDYFTTGDENFDEETGASFLDLGAVAMKREQIVEQFEDDEQIIRDFEAETGKSITVYKLVAVGSIWDFVADSND